MSIPLGQIQACQGRLNIHSPEKSEEIQKMVEEDKTVLMTVGETKKLYESNKLLWGRIKKNRIMNMFGLFGIAIGFWSIINGTFNFLMQGDQKHLEVCAKKVAEVVVPKRMMFLPQYVIDQYLSDISESIALFPNNQKLQELYNALIQLRNANQNQKDLTNLILYEDSLAMQKLKYFYKTISPWLPSMSLPSLSSLSSFITGAKSRSTGTKGEELLRQVQARNADTINLMEEWYGGVKSAREFVFESLYFGLCAVGILIPLGYLLKFSGGVARRGVLRTGGVALRGVQGAGNLALMGFRGLLTVAYHAIFLFAKSFLHGKALIGVLAYCSGLSEHYTLSDVLELVYPNVEANKLVTNYFVNRMSDGEAYEVSLTDPDLASTFDLSGNAPLVMTKTSVQGMEQITITQNGATVVSEPSQAFQDGGRYNCWFISV